MRLIIAEKPSVARAVAGVIGGSERADGYIRCSGDTTITWARGHLLALAKPEEYKGGRIDVADLPLIPSEFRKSPRDKDAEQQLKVIAGLLAKAGEVVHAGDPDREGQLLVDEILKYCGWVGPTKRLWLSAVDSASIRKALDSISDNREMAGLSASAECRSRADWLVGFNGSIALSRKIQAAGGSEALSIGRVQTPTLALVARRDTEIGSFSKRNHYLVTAMIADEIRAKWKMPEDLDGLSDDGLLLDKAVADQTAERITGKPATVQSFQAKQGSRAAPLPHCLSSLQKAASSRFGMSAKTTLAAAQSLYEGGVTTYPRTDCQYLPEEQHSDAGKVLEALVGMDISGASEADPVLKHSAWNTSKVEAHHAIVPTGKPLQGDAKPEARKLFSLIAEAFIRLFFPPERFETREVTFDIDGLTFVAKSRTTLEPCWTKLGQDDDGDAADPTDALPDMAEGDRQQCERGEVEAKETKPPKHYNDGTLIGAMTRIHSLVEDPKLKARLKETSGLGTEATRAGIIETLVGRGYLERKGKEIRATKKGKSLIEAVRQVYPPAADPGVTAAWEDALSSVEAGKMTAEQFMQAQQGQVGKLVSAILGAGQIEGLSPAVTDHKCPQCGAGLVERKSKKGFRFLACSSPTCGAAYFRERDGSPGNKLGEAGQKHERQAGNGPACPECGEATIEAKTKNGKPYLRCPAHGAWWPGEDGKTLGKKWPPRSK